MRSDAMAAGAESQPAAVKLQVPRLSGSWMVAAALAVPVGGRRVDSEVGDDGDAEVRNGRDTKAGG